MARRCLAIALACLVAGVSLPGASAPLGIITQSERAHVGTVDASPGATIYDGDKLSTEEGGVLRLRTGVSSLYLPAHSGLTLRNAGNGALAELTQGSLILSSTVASAMEIRAREVRIHAVENSPTIAQVTIIGPKELRVTSRRGILELTYGDDTERIEEGATYRVLLDPTPADIPYAVNGRGPGAWPAKPPRGAGRPGKGIILIMAIGAIGGTYWFMKEAWESPDQP